MNATSYRVEVSHRREVSGAGWETTASRPFNTLGLARDYARKHAVLELERVTDQFGATDHAYTYGPYLEELPLGEFSRTRGYDVSAHSELRATVFSRVIIHESEATA